MYIFTNLHIQHHQLQVNADRTVVATMYQPSAEAFRLFDSLMLLSKGRVIYSGRISGATDFFVNSPYQYFFTNYNNPADFLADISGGQISDCKVKEAPAELCLFSFCSRRRFDEINKITYSKLFHMTSNCFLLPFLL